MNKENAISKINKFGKIGKIISIIMIVVVAFSLVATLVSSIAMDIIPEDVMTLKVGTQAELSIKPSAIDPSFDQAELQAMSSAFDSGDAGLNLGVIRVKLEKAEIVGDTLVAKSNENIDTLSLHSIGNALLLVVATLALTLISLIFACRLCRAFEKCQSPFADEIIRKMRAFAWSLLPWAVFSSLSQSVVNSIFANNLEIGVSLDMNIIFTVIVIFALTIVFKYGAILQQESDETL